MTHDQIQNQTLLQRLTRFSLVWKILAILAALVIIYMSLRPGSGTQSVPYFDKVQHFIAYAGLAGLARLGWRKTWGGWLFLLVMALGVAVEFGQGSMSLGRTASVYDAVANTLGALSALLIFHFWSRRAP